jgi:hypothetical protein
MKFTRGLSVIAATFVLSLSLARSEERPDPSALVQEPMGDVRLESSPLPFFGATPCRLVDTRQAGFPAGFGPPALAAGVPRNFDLNSDPLCPEIPAGAQAYSLNIT